MQLQKFQTNPGGVCRAVINCNCAAKMASYFDNKQLYSVAGYFEQSLIQYNWPGLNEFWSLGPSEEMSLFSTFKASISGQ